jgi:septum formation protein
VTEPAPRRAAPRQPAFVLASGSARRRDLLASASLAFEVEPSDVPEEPSPGEAPRGFARRLAAEKAHQVAARRREAGDARPVLGADTIVVVEGKILGKPRDRAEAGEMLRALSGREHEVVTGFAIVDDRGAARVEEVVTVVRFRVLLDEEIEEYLESGEWLDKAGAYAIQGGAAGFALSIAGSYTNVVGLPLAQVVEALRVAAGWSPSTHSAARGKSPRAPSKAEAE